VVVGTLLLGLSRGIAAGMRRAYDATQVILVSGALLGLLKSLAVEESVFLLSLSLLLSANRSSFDRRGYP
jgi:phosphatidylglycerol lysyltransferase